MQIEAILEEANAHGLRLEVETFARKIILDDPNFDTLEAYKIAFGEWVK